MGNNSLFDSIFELISIMASQLVKMLWPVFLFLITIKFGLWFAGLIGLY